MTVAGTSTIVEYTGPCRGPMHGECPRDPDDEIVLRFKYTETDAPFKRATCAVCGTTNELTKVVQ